MSSGSGTDSESSDDDSDNGTTNVAIERSYSENLDKNLTTKEKFKIMNEEIMKLNHQLTYMQMLISLKAEGTTKKGRVAHRVGCNRSIMTSIRDVMADVIFPHCKFIGKMDLQTTADGSIADVLMRNLSVGIHLKKNKMEMIKFRLEWWGRNCELVEKCLVDHKTKTTQNLKKRYLSGKTKILLLFNLN